MKSSPRRTAVAIAQLAALSAGALALTSAAVAATPVGALDPTFSPGGKAGVTDVIALRQLVDVAVQQDGKVVAISDQSLDFFIVRFNTDGSLDTTFGLTGTGVVSVDVAGAGVDDDATALIIDPQNRIVVAGKGGAAPADFALVRLSPDGKVVDLNVHTHVGNLADPAGAADVALQSDGTIVTAGTTKVGADTDFAVVRFDGATGAVAGTKFTDSFGTGNESARGVAVYPSGPNKDKFVVVGDSGTAGNSAMIVNQRLANGSVDMSFNATGNRVIDPTVGSDSARGVAITAAGSIVVAGTNGAADQDLVVAQLLPSGAFDPAFNGGGVRTLVKPGSEFAQNHALALQPDGKILLTADTSGVLDVGVFRLTPDGSADNTFGTNGDGTFDVNGNDDGNAIAYDPAGRVVVAGDEQASAGFVARIIAAPDTDGDGVLDPADACPTVPGTLPNGCAVVPAPEAVLKGKKVLLSTVLAKKQASAKCPPKATVAVKTKSKKGTIKVTKLLRTKSVATGCLVKGKIKLPAKPKKTAKVKVTVKGTKLTTKRLLAVRA